MIGAIRRYFARRRIEGMFGAYVSQDMVKQMVESGREPELGGRDRELTPFFASIDSYVGLAEKLTSAQVGEVVNAWFGLSGDAIAAQGGCIDKFIGDIVVAMFGAPVEVPDHAARACAAAARIQEEMEMLRRRFSDESRWPAPVRCLRARIGLHTGVAMVGNMGIRTRFNYTMMGDDVNVAARLEKVAKAHGVWTLCSETARAQCRQKVGDDIIFRSLGRVVIMGRERPLQIFELVGRREAVTDRTREGIALFEQGMDRYLARDWDGAIEYFTRSAPLERDQPDQACGIRTNPSIRFADAARSAKANPDALSPFF